MTSLIDVYRIGPGDRWRRRWQAELADASLDARRGWTRSGAWRRMDRAQRLHHVDQVRRREGRSWPWVAHHMARLRLADWRRGR